MSKFISGGRLLLVSRSWLLVQLEWLDLSALNILDELLNGFLCQLFRSPWVEVFEFLGYLDEQKEVLFRVDFHVFRKTRVILAFGLDRNKNTWISVKISLLLNFSFQSAATSNNNSLAFCPIYPWGTNKKTAFLLSENTSPLALSSKGKTKGRSKSPIQFFRLWSILLFWTLCPKGLKISMESAGLLPCGAW